MPADAVVGVPVVEVPVVVVVENNGYAEMTPADLLTAVPAHERAAAYRITGTSTDGNDPVAVAEAVSAARAAALTSGRPALVEAMTQRLVGHYSGDAQAYRPAGELAAARQADPLPRLAARIGDDAAASAAQARVQADLDAALTQARACPPADPATALSGIYQEVTA